MATTGEVCYTWRGPTVVGVGQLGLYITWFIADVKLWHGPSPVGLVFLPFLAWIFYRTVLDAALKVEWDEDDIRWATALGRHVSRWDLLMQAGPSRFSSDGLFWEAKFADGSRMRVSASTAHGALIANLEAHLPPADDDPGDVERTAS